MSGKKLFVGGLSWDTTEDGMREAFAPHGEVVSAKVVTDRESGRSRGFGFVEYTTDDAAATAASELNGTVLDGKEIKVEVAKEREPRSGGGGGGFNRGRY